MLKDFAEQWSYYNVSMVVHEQSPFVFLDARGKDACIEKVCGVIVVQYHHEELTKCSLDDWECKLDVLTADPCRVLGFVVD